MNNEPVDRMPTPITDGLEAALSEQVVDLYGERTKMLRQLERELNAAKEENKRLLPRPNGETCFFGLESTAQAAARSTGIVESTRIPRRDFAAVEQSTTTNHAELGAAILVDGEIVAWFKNPDESCRDWCSENHFGKWIAWRAKPPEIVPLTPEEQARVDAESKRLAELFRSLSE